MYDYRVENIVRWYDRLEFNLPISTGKIVFVYDDSRCVHRWVPAWTIEISGDSVLVGLCYGETRMTVPKANVGIPMHNGVRMN